MAAKPGRVAKVRARAELAAAERRKAYKEAGKSAGERILRAEDGEKFKIETDIPPPEGRGGWGWVNQMEVGDSVFVSVTESNAERRRDKLRNTCERLRSAGKSFTIRKVPGGYRIWRVK